MLMKRANAKALWSNRSAKSAGRVFIQGTDWIVLVGRSCPGVWRVFLRCDDLM
jgi:hypothetical protein